MVKQSAATRKSFYKKRGFLWSVGSLLFIILVVSMAFRLSPVPGAMVIRAVFTNNANKTEKAMEPYAPKEGITVLKNQQYRAGDTDAQLDVYYSATASKPAPVIIWTHGGAWVSGDKSNDAPYFKMLAARGFTVIGLNYTLAPKKSYPYQIFQLNDAYAYIKKEAARFHADTSRIFLAGDSAGSQLSSEVAALTTNPAYAKEVGITPNLQPAQLKGLVLNCGIYKMEDLTQPDPALPKIVGWGSDVSVWAYAGTRDFSNPVIRQMSPYYHVTKDFPPTYITGGNADDLTAAQSQPFGDKLASLGVDVDSLFFPSDYQPPLEHEYQFGLGNVAGGMSFEKTVEFVRKHSQP